MWRNALAAAVLLAQVVCVQAKDASHAQLARAMDGLRIPELVAIFHSEGLDYAQTLNRDLLDGEGGATFAAQVRGIYNVQRMQDTVRTALGALSQTELGEINGFLDSELGGRVMKLELAARHAMRDDDIEAQARASYEAARDDPKQAARLGLIDRFVTQGDMIEQNVTGALNTNLSFYRGLVEGGGFAMSEGEMLYEAWSQEDEIRADTQSWLMGYLMLSYSPLSAHDLERYVTFADAPAGRALNRAIFAGFNTMYEEISYALGQAVSVNMETSDL